MFRPQRGDRDSCHHFNHCRDAHRQLRQSKTVLSVHQRFRTATVRGRVLIEPVLVTAEFPKKFDEGIYKLNALIRAELTASGYTVLSEKETAAALDGLKPHGKDVYHPSTGLLDLAKVKKQRFEYLTELKKRDACDLVVSAGIVKRRAEYLGSTARWDGVAVSCSVSVSFSVVRSVSDLCHVICRSIDIENATRLLLNQW